MKKHIHYLLLAVLLLTACHGNRSESPVKFVRFEQMLFDTPANQLQATLSKNREALASPLLNVLPDNPQYMEMLRDFVSDPVMRDIYKTTESQYHDLGWLEDELGDALRRMEALCPNIHYKGFYTMITGDYQDYSNRVFCDENSLAISIDHYVLGSLSHYQYFNTPAYLVRLLGKEYLTTDCMAAIARQHSAMPEGDLTLLDYAILEGKALYFLDQVLPDKHDTLKIRYTKEQLSWMKDNIEGVWSWIIQNQMLYSTDYTQLRNLVDDAPKTNAFGEGSAPRTPAYIGWQIVKQYMKKSGSTLPALLEETDSRRILTESGWRP